MLVATLIAVLGLLSVGISTEFAGYRMGGSITVPVVAVYTLKNFGMHPIFLASTGAAYVGLYILRRRTLIFGRDELVAAMVIGTTVPVVSLLLAIQVGLEVGVVAFLGSILPGLAAYNYHRITPEFRRNDRAEMGRQLLADGDRITPFVYLRRDRRGRTASFASYIGGLFERGLIDEAHLAGANARAFAETVDGPTHQYDRQTSADDLLDALLASGRPVILMGNTVDEFMRDLQESLEARVLHP